MNTINPSSDITTALEYIESPEAIAKWYNRIQALSWVTSTMDKSISTTTHLLVQNIKDPEARRTIFEEIVRINYLDSLIFNLFKKPFREYIPKDWMKYDNLDKPIVELDHKDLVSILACIEPYFDERLFNSFMESEATIRAIDTSVQSTVPGRPYTYPQEFLERDSNPMNPGEFSWEITYDSLSLEGKRKVDFLGKIICNALSIIAVGKHSATFSWNLGFHWSEGEISWASNLKDGGSLVSTKVITWSQDVQVWVAMGTSRQVSAFETGLCEHNFYISCVKWADRFWEELDPRSLLTETNEPSAEIDAILKLPNL